jgi:hypothetical protein
MLYTYKLIVGYQLQEISDVDYQSSRKRRDIDPRVLMKNLKTTNVVLKKNCEERVV